MKSIFVNVANNGQCLSCFHSMGNIIFVMVSFANFKIDSIVIMHAMSAVDCDVNMSARDLLFQ